MTCDPFKGTALLFSDIIGEPEPFFAWWPVRCYDGRWAWLCIAWRRLCLVKPIYSGPDDPFWQYARSLK